MSAEAYESFGREYRRLYSRAAELSLFRYGSESKVERHVADVVKAIDRALAGQDGNVAYLAMAHVLEHHFMSR